MGSDATWNIIVCFTHVSLGVPKNTEPAVRIRKQIPTMRAKKAPWVPGAMLELMYGSIIGELGPQKKSALAVIVRPNMPK